MRPLFGFHMRDFDDLRPFYGFAPDIGSGLGAVHEQRFGTETGKTLFEVGPCRYIRKRRCNRLDGACRRAEHGIAVRRGLDGQALQI